METADAQTRKIELAEESLQSKAANMINTLSKTDFTQDMYV